MIVIYEALDTGDANLKQQKLDNADLFKRGLERYRTGDFREARLFFASCLVRVPLDEAAVLYIGRCVKLIGQAPARHCDGATVLSRKYLPSEQLLPGNCHS